jgi:hypothetical protein
MNDFWLKKDPTSMARSLRLAVIQNQFDAGNLDEEQARELLSGPLTAEDDSTVYDDSGCLSVKKAHGEC